MGFLKSRLCKAKGAGMAIIVCLLSGTFCPGAGWCQEAEAEDPLTFTFYWENDAITGTDKDYTNGLKLTWSSPFTAKRQDKDGLTTWIMDRLPFINNSNTQRATSLSLGQNIYTPEATDRSDLVEDERPYAGYTYVGFGFHSQRENRRDVWELDIGVVGPFSQGETLNHFAHDTLGFDRSQGWDNQLENELGIEAVCETKWRVWQMPPNHGFGADLTTHLGGSVGNIAIHFNTGAELRLGWFVPQDFGTCPIRPGCDVGMALGDSVDRFKKTGFAAYIFLAVDGRWVLRDIFLDGNTFQDSHHVDKEPFVADYLAGLAVTYRRFRFSYAFVQRTKEFKEQDESHAFGAVSIAYVF